MERLAGRRLCLLMFAAILIAAVVPKVEAQPTPNSTAPNEALTKLNVEFRASYARARAVRLAQSGPVLLFDGEKLVLLRGDDRRVGTPVGPAYHHLKTVAHLPLAVFVELAGTPDGPLPADVAERLRAFRDGVSAVDRDFDQIDFATGDRDAQRRILTASAGYLDGVLQRGVADAAALRAFAAALEADIERNIDVAAALELGHYQAQIEAWRRELTDDHWRTLHAVVIGSQMPRRDNRVVQLFAALLGLAGEGPRIVYAEGLYEEQRALNLLGTHLLDAEAASTFFDDPARLERDLLADGAAKYVREHVRPIP